MNFENKKQGEDTRDAILDFVKQYMMKKQYPPTVQEICDGIGMKSNSSIYRHLEKLEDDGKLMLNEGKPRTIVVPGIEYREV